MAGICKSWWQLLLALLAGGLMVVTAGQRKDAPATPPVPLDDWDIPQLVAFLNGEGMGLRIVTTKKDGTIPNTAFLTTTTKGWDEFNKLTKNEKQISQWQGTLYCKRAPGEAYSDQIHLWGDCCLVVGPFLLYGDRELLDRVHAVLIEIPTDRSRIGFQLK